MGTRRVEKVGHLRVEMVGHPATGATGQAPKMRRASSSALRQRPV